MPIVLCRSMLSKKCSALWNQASNAALVAKTMLPSSCTTAASLLLGEGEKGIGISG